MPKKPDGIDRDLGHTPGEVLSSMSQIAEKSLRFIPGPPHPDLGGPVPRNEDGGVEAMKQRDKAAAAAELAQARNVTARVQERPNNGEPLGALTHQERVARSKGLAERPDFAPEAAGNPGVLSAETRRARAAHTTAQNPRSGTSQQDTMVMPTPKPWWKKLIEREETEKTVDTSAKGPNITAPSKAPSR